jgi:23S rRNA (guanosine2251-2'-O)-methyltransferase
VSALVLLAGRRAVLEALRAGKRRIEGVWYLEGGHGGPLKEIIDLATSHRIPLNPVSREILDGMAGNTEHRGVLARAEQTTEPTLDELIALAKASGEPPLLVALDEIKDPHNVGAIIRTADAAGAHGIVTTTHRTAPAEGPGVERASAGAAEYVPVSRVVNLRDALDRCREAGIWVVGADMDGDRDYTEADLKGPVILVMGEEGKGIRPLTRKTCDMIVRIPMRGKVASLNVSASAAILLFEAARQRRASRPA